ncbi:MAG TPA: hypothetical protein VIV11_20690 [Kofleriaceae bacterium]
MSEAVSDREIGDTTDPYVPSPILQERTSVFARSSSFARPSSQYPLARAELDDPTALFDREDVPTVRGRTARSYHVRDDEVPTPVREPQSHPIVPLRVVGANVPPPIAQPAQLRVVGRRTPPPIPPPARDAQHRLPPPIPLRRERRVTPVELDASYAAALRKLR